MRRINYFITVDPDAILSTINVHDWELVSVSKRLRENFDEYIVFYYEDEIEDINEDIKSYTIDNMRDCFKAGMDFVYRNGSKFKDYIRTIK